MKWTILGIFLLLLPFVVADVTDQVYAVQAEIGDAELPGPVGVLFGDQRVNIYIETAQGEEIVIGVVTEDNMLKGAQVAKVKDPTLWVRIKESTINEIMGSSNQLQALQQGLKNKDITYGAIGFTNKIKFGFISMIAKVAGIFSDDVEVYQRDEQEGDAKDYLDIEDVNNIDTEPVDEDTGEVLSATDTPGEEDNQVDVDGPLTGVDATEEVDGVEEHVVLLIAEGLSRDDLTAAVGDTVIFENTREGRWDKGLMIGTGICAKGKSGFFTTGETFSYTFEKAGNCNFVDGIYTTKLLKVTIE